MSESRPLVPLSVSALLSYMRRQFPLYLIHKMLAHNFANREFMLTLNQDSHAYVTRGHTFNTLEELHSFLHRNPVVRIDIGPIFNVPVVLKKCYHECVAVARELVFDIDLDDQYDLLRDCCTGKKMCVKCLKLAAIAVRVIDFYLKETMDCKNTFAVFSGSKGFHLWVMDSNISGFDQVYRTTICKNLKLLMQMPPQSKANPLFDAIFNEILAPFFRDHYISSHPKSAARIAAKYNFCLVSALEALGSLIEKPSFRSAVTECLWPRLDEKVTTGMTHMIKAPFVVHHITNRIAIPVAVKDLETFSLNTVPYLSSDGVIHNQTIFNAAREYFARCIEVL
jgi:DNA primase small subunit